MQPDYSQIQQLLVQERALTDAAEAHGTLAGCLCSAAGYRFEDWLRRSCPRGRPQPQHGATLARALQRDRRRPRAAGHGVRPAAARGRAADRGAHRGARAVVPGISLRARRRRHTDAAQLPGDVGEIVRDFAEITRAGGRQRAGRGIQRERLRGARGVRARRRAAAVRGAGRGTPPRGPRAAQRCTEGATQAPWRETSSRAAAAS